MSAQDNLSRQQFASHRIVVHPPGPMTNEEIDITPDLEHTVEVPAHQILHTEQQELQPHVLDYYRQHGIDIPIPGSMQSDHNDETPGVPHRPTVVDYAGKRWLADGHHKAIASRDRGEPSFTAWHVDPARDRQEYEDWAAGRGKK